MGAEEGDEERILAEGRMGFLHTLSLSQANPQMNVPLPLNGSDTTVSSSPTAHEFPSIEVLDNKAKARCLCLEPLSLPIDFT